MNLAEAASWYLGHPEYLALAPGSKANVRIQLDYIVGNHGSVGVRDIQGLSSVSAALCQLAIDGHGNKASDCVGKIRQILIMLAQQGRCDMASVDVFRPLTPPKSVPRRPWTKEEMKAVMSYSGRLGGLVAIRNIALLCYYTGQRVGDVLRLTGKNLSGDDDRMSLSVTQEKTQKTLVIPVHRAIRRTFGDVKGHFVVYDNKPVSKSEFYKMWRAAKVALNLPSNLHIHGLRKNCAISMIENGASAYEAAAVTGQSVEVLNYYVRLRDQKVLAQRGMSKLEEIDVGGPG